MILVHESREIADKKCVGGSLKMTGYVPNVCLSYSSRRFGDTLEVGG